MNYKIKSCLMNRWYVILKVKVKKPKPNHPSQIEPECITAWHKMKRSRDDEMMRRFQLFFVPQVKNLSIVTIPMTDFSSLAPKWNKIKWDSDPNNNDNINLVIVYYSFHWNSIIKWLCFPFPCQSVTVGKCKGKPKLLGPMLVYFF